MRVPDRVRRFLDVDEVQIPLHERPQFTCCIGCATPLLTKVRSKESRPAFKWVTCTGCMTTTLALSHRVNEDVVCPTCYNELGKVSVFPDVLHVGPPQGKTVLFVCATCQSETRIVTGAVRGVELRCPVCAGVRAKQHSTVPVPVAAAVP